MVKPIEMATSYKYKRLMGADYKRFEILLITGEMLKSNEKCITLKLN